MLQYVRLQVIGQCLSAGADGEEDGGLAEVLCLLLALLLWPNEFRHYYSLFETHAISSDIFLESNTFIIEANRNNPFLCMSFSRSGSLWGPDPPPALE